MLRFLLGAEVLRFTLVLRLRGAEVVCLGASLVLRCG